MQCDHLSAWILFDTIATPGNMVVSESIIFDVSSLSLLVLVDTCSHREKKKKKKKKWVKEKKKADGRVEGEVLLGDYETQLQSVLCLFFCV